MSSVPQTVAPAARHKVRLAAPGPSWIPGAWLGVQQASSRHEQQVATSGDGWNDFNILWLDALNAAERGECTHFAMLHSDIIPQPGWLDILIEDMESRQVSLASVPSAIKDQRGLSSTGIGDPENRWNPLRRFTFRELATMPQIFDAAEAGYPGGILLHNTGCWVCDLRDERFSTADAEGNLLAHFDFPRRVYRDPESGLWAGACESEDWFFSRRIHELGIPSVVTQRVELNHRGVIDYPNKGAWGLYEYDQDTAKKWRS